jgi:LysM repeat protein
VKAGDSLGAIAKATGHTVQELQTWNNIADPNSISIGQVLKLTP